MAADKERVRVLLLAVTDAVEKAVGVRNWVKIAQIMQHIAPDEKFPWLRQRAYDRYRDAVVGKTPEAIEAIIAAVDPESYKDTLQHILKHGEAPTEAPPVIPGVNHTEPNDKEPAPIHPTRSDDFRERVEWRKLASQQQHDHKVAEALVDQAALTELLVEAVERGAQTAPPIIWTPAPTIILKPDTEEEVPVILMGDIHGGAEIKPDEVGGLGEFNFRIFKRRLDNYLERILSTLLVHRNSAIIKKAVLNILGDCLEGEVIFDGQAVRIEMVSVDQLFEVAEYVVNWIQRLLAAGLLDTLDVIAIFGNHGRTTHKKGATKAHANWDYVLYRYMAALLKNEPRVKWFIPKAWFAVYQIFEWKLYCTHGDVIKSWLGIPFYGIQRHDARTTLLLQSVDLQYNYWICGDKHVSATIPRVEGAQIMNGSIVGGSDFSMHQLGTASEPMQTMFGISEKRGKTWQYDFVLDRRDPEEIRKNLAFVQI